MVNLMQKLKFTSNKILIFFVIIYIKHVFFRYLVLLEPKEKIGAELCKDEHASRN